MHYTSHSEDKIPDTSFLPHALKKLKCYIYFLFPLYMWLGNGGGGSLSNVIYLEGSSGLNVKSQVISPVLVFDMSVYYSALFPSVKYFLPFTATMKR